MASRTFLLLVLLPVLLPAASPADIDRRVEDILARMTLEEKLGQMSQSSAMQAPMSEKIKGEIRRERWGSFLNAGLTRDRAEAQRIARTETRLKIPLVFGRDVIHGYRTVLPIPLGQSCSWDPALVREAARMAARETKIDGIHWTFSPMLDIAHDPRWGRVAESLGEDPYLASALGVAMVQGFAAEGIAACAKHYVGYGASEGGRDYNTTNIPENLLRNLYLPPFHAVVQAGVASVMTAFNDLNGIPTSGNVFTIRQILRKEWHFDGLVVSDWDSVLQMIDHGYAADDADAAWKGIRAGVEMEMNSMTYYDHAAELLKTGKISQQEIDNCVRDILRFKFRLGLFDAPIPDPARAAELTAPLPEALGTARKLARESIVLLKNEGDLLPLAATTGKIAVVGPLANAPLDQMGTWVMDGRPTDVQTPLAALRQQLGNEKILWAQGLANSRDTSSTSFASAVAAAKDANLTILFLGEEQILSGEAHSRAFLDLPGAQNALVDALAGTGKPMITVIQAGRPLTFQYAAERSAAVLYAFHPGTVGGPALADLLLGREAPSGRLTMTFPRAVGQIPIYYNHMNTGRPPSPNALGIPPGTPLDPKGYTSNYLDLDFTPQYPFGFGLSYTTFAYGNFRLSTKRLKMDDRLEASAEIANTGKREADEVVQLYIRALSGSVTRPVRELRGFQRVHLKGGERQTVTFSLTTRDLAFYNEREELVTEPGRYHIWIAPDSSRGTMASLEVVN